MNKVLNTTQQTKKHARQAKKEVKPWLKILARLGYGSKGFVYFLVGALALKASWGAGSPDVNTKDALVEIVTKPFGNILLGLVSFGLVGYVLWRFVQAFADPENFGTGAKGILRRTGYAISGVIYAALGVFAVQLIAGSGGGGNRNAPEDWTARIMAQPFGLWMVAAIGAIFIGLAAFEAYRAYSAQFRRKFNLAEMSRTEDIWATRIGRIGQVARGVVHLILGGFLIQAAIHYDPDKAGGLGEALQALARQPYGFLILGCLAFGLICYGIYCGVLAKYRRIYW